MLWVEASPQPGPPENPGYPDDLEDGDGATLDERYVKTVGDNMTGNLTLGTDKITLDATGGSANFAGDVTVNSYADGCVLFADGGATFAGAKVAINGDTGDATFGVDKAAILNSGDILTATKVEIGIGDVDSGTSGVYKTLVGSGAVYCVRPEATSPVFRGRNYRFIRCLQELMQTARRVLLVM